MEKESRGLCGGREPGQSRERSNIILLNGPSSSGKSTLGTALWEQLPEPYLYFSSDQLVAAGIVSNSRSEESDGPWAWHRTRPKFFAGFHRCISALADAGNSVIVEHVIELPDWYDDCVRLLAHHHVFFVGVFCPLPILEARERARGDRQIGEGRSHIEDGVHTWGPYDLEVDTSLGTPESNASAVIESFSKATRPTAFERAYAELRARASCEDHT